jgi:hypothetical protein
MRHTLAMALLALFVLARAAVAQNVQDEAGVPLSPAEAAGGWTLEAGGHAICMVRLASDHGAAAGAGCAGALPGGVAGWKPTSNGMALTDASGQVVLPFSRWSNSLFVGTAPSGDYLQLMRGGPHPQGQ